MKSEAEARAWIGDIARKATERRKAQIAATTPAQAREMLLGVIRHMPEPEDLTDQDITDYADLGFVVDWLDVQQMREARAAHQMQGVSIALTTGAVLFWYGVLTTGTRGVWLGVTIMLSALALVACTTVLLQAWREAR